MTLPGQLSAVRLPRDVFRHTIKPSRRLAEQLTPKGPVPGREDPDRLIEIAAEFIRLHDSGQLIDVDAYCARYPESERNALRRECQQILRMRGFMNPQGKLISGQAFASYEIVEQIGRGGMGEVYRARDTKLNREVAIKVLPPDLASRPGRVERFEREAKAIAALDHPNIVTIHSVESTGSVPFLTMQLIEGETLAEKIPKKGLSLAKLFKLAIPMADAISTAHEHGIVHRDLKPANVMVTEEDRVKILDFGLAKLREEAPSSGPDDSTLQPVTDEGTIVGTAAYMSPEQAEGKMVDHRSDIFSLGIMLYEMATGERPFKGDTKASVISSILRDTPSSITELNAELPRHLGRVVRRCLAKEVDVRYQTAKDVRNELVELKKEVDSGEMELRYVGHFGPKPSRRGVGRWQIAGLAGVLMAAVSVAVWLSGGSNQPAWKEFGISISNGMRLYGGEPGESWHVGGERPTRAGMVITQGGEVIMSVTDGTTSGLYRQQHDRPQSLVPIMGTEGGSMPFLNPDETEIGFYVEETPGMDVRGSLWSVPIQGGERRRLVREEIRTLTGAEWGRDGYIYYNNDGEGIFKTRAFGGDTQQLTQVDRSTGQDRHAHPHLLPGGELLYTVRRDVTFRWERAEIWAKRLPDGDPHLVVADGADAQFYRAHEGSEGAYLLFGRRGSLMAARFDTDLLKITTAERPVVPAVMQAINGWNTDLDLGCIQVAVSANHLLFVPGGAYEPELQTLFWKHEQETRVPFELGDELGPYVARRISPDGTHVAVERGQADRDIVIWGLDGWTYEIRELGKQAVPTWSPDGEWLAFVSNQEGPDRIFKRRMQAPYETIPLTEGQRIIGWSPEGILFFSRRDGSVYKVDENGGVETRVWDRADVDRMLDWPTISPDGEWLVYCERDRPGIFVRPIQDIHSERPLVQEGGRPAFAKDGARVFYQVGDSFEVIGFDTENGEAKGKSIDLFTEDITDFIPVRGWDVTPDGEFLLSEGLPHPKQPVTSIQIILNVPQYLEEQFKGQGKRP